MSSPLEWSDELLLRQCTVRHLRRGGPGGQHRNKVETAVQLIHPPSGLQAEANEKRSQAENLKTALFRLRIEMALHLRSTREQPSSLWLSRVADEKIAINPSHRDFPLLLAEALDLAFQSEGEWSELVVKWRTTGSQLLKLLKKEPRALQLFNSLRRDKGLRPLQ